MTLIRDVPTLSPKPPGGSPGASLWVGQATAVAATVRASLRDVAGTSVPSADELLGPVSRRLSWLESAMAIVTIAAGASVPGDGADADLVASEARDLAREVALLALSLDGAVPLDLTGARDLLRGVNGTALPSGPVRREEVRQDLPGAKRMTA